MNNTRRGFLSASAIFGATAALPAAQAQTPQGQARASRSGGLPRRGEFLLRHAHVLSMDPAIGDIARGDIHVRDGVIVAVGADLTAPGAQIIDGEAMIALPGLVETHWHMWTTAARNLAGDDDKTGYFPAMHGLGQTFTPEDNARGVRLSLAEALNGGVTTVHNWSHNLPRPEYADAELQAHQALGGRALFGYGYSSQLESNRTLPLADVARVQRDWLPKLDGRVTLGIASRTPSPATLDIIRREWTAAREMGLRITSHMGISRTTFEQQHGVRVLDKAGLLGPDVLLVHDTWTDEADLELMARAGVAQSVSPYTEMRTGFGFTPIMAMLKAGAPVSLSFDTAMLCGACDMFAVMKALQNLGDASQLSEFALPARRVLEIATMGGARALGLDNKIGSITPGKRADIIMLRTRDLNMAPRTDAVRMVVQSAQPANVDFVMVDGRILKRGGRLLTVDTDKLVDDANETMERMRADIARKATTAPT